MVFNLNNGFRLESTCWLVKLRVVVVVAYCICVIQLCIALGKHINIVLDVLAKVGHTRIGMTYQCRASSRCGLQAQLLVWVLGSQDIC